MPATNASKVRFLDHVVLGSFVGVVFGLVMFAVEPIWLLGGREFRLGASPATLAAVFTTMGWVIGMIAGTVGGVVLPRLRPASSVRSVVVLYVALFAYVGLALTLRSLIVFKIWNVTRRPPFVVAAVAAPVLALLAVLAASLPGRGKGRLRRRLCAAVAVLLVLVANAWSIVATPRPRGLATRDPEKPNVVLIVLDALRRDRLSCYGYERNTSPNIDRLARDGALFLRAYSHGPRTVYAMPSLLVSQYPAFHTMMHYQARSRPLPESRTTISEMLRDAGYSTACVVTNPYLRSNFGTIQGYDIADQFGAQKFELGFFWVLRKARLLELPYYATHRKPKAEEVTDRAIARTRQLAGGPFFLFVHYMDTHHAYLPPPQFEKSFLTEQNAPSPDEVYDLTRYFYVDRKLPEPHVLRTLEDYYDACIQYNDREIGRLIDEIKHIDHESLIIITSDHGDEFLEHGYLYHTNIAYEELIHVPLIMSIPGGFAGGTRVEASARHIDVLPTIAELVGVAPPSTAMGRSLLPAVRGEDDGPAVESYAQGPFNAALNVAPWKVLHDDTLNTFSLFNLSEDPGETRNLWLEDPDLQPDLRKRLEEYIETGREIDRRGGQELDADTVRRLKALGYL